MKSGILREYSSLLEFLLRITDATTIVGAGIIAYYIRFGSLDMPLAYRFVLLISAAVLLYVFQSHRLYQSSRGMRFFDEIKKITQATGIIFLALAGISVALKASGDFSRIWAMIWAIFTVGFLLTSRVAIRSTLYELRKRGYNTRSVVIVGDAKQIVRAKNIINAAPWLGLNMIGYIPVDCLIYNDVDLPKLGEVGQIETTLSEYKVDQVWLVTTFEQSQLANVVLQQLKQSPVTIRWLPHFFDFQLVNHSISEVDGYPILNLSDTPIKGVSLMTKWIQDKLLSLLILVMISPLMLIIAVAIKITSKGPVLFKQDRHGEKGNLIQIYKFRSMCVHDEGDSVTQATKGDSRITPLGAFLRKTSLDELPQFINVLRGDMSIVGPRPHAVVHNLQYRDSIDSYMRRHGVKPGITGWAQVNGLRGETDTLDKMERRVEADMHYINNWSLWLDIKIIVLTVFRGFTGGNAY